MDSREGSDKDEDEGSPEDSSDEESDMEVESTTMESKQSVQSTAEFLDHFRQQFIADVDASTIVLELEHRGIISDGDQKTIRQEVNATLQARLLHACLKKTCDAKALTDVCDIIATVKGNPRMKSFGEHMKTEWEKESANEEMPGVLDNTSSIPELHHSSARSSPSPGSQAAEQSNFEVSLERALQQECVEVDVLKCVTLGPPGVGKSQLRRALTGSYEEVTESTPVSTGAEVIIQKYMDSEAMWQKFDLWDGQKALVASVREGKFGEVLPDTRSQRSLSSRKQMSNDVKVVHNIVKVRARCKKFRETRDNMMKQLQQTDATGQKSLHKARIIHLIDSGGQPSFFDVHATLATSRAAYLQVFNLAEALDSKPQMSYRRSFPTKELYSPFRNIDFVARTFATLHDCKKKFMQMDETIKTVMSGHKSNDLPIFLIGTHLDKTLSSNEKVSSAIKKECHTFPNWNEVVPNDNLSFHPVSCLAEGRAGIKALQRKISECRGGYPIRLPLSWFFVELMFWSEKGAGDGCMKYSELRDMCVQDKLLQSEDEDEFFTMVNLFHLLGLFIFPDLDRGLEGDKLDDFPVFTDPNFLFDEVSKILDIQFRTGVSGSLKNLQETGMLQEGALGDLGIPTSAGTLMHFHDWFKDFLIMWGLAAVVKTRRGRGKAQKTEQAQELFIPSVLPPRPSDVELDVDSSLLVAFLDEDDSGSYHIPQGIFSHFIARLVHDKGYTVAPRVYRDLVSFKNVCRERVTYTVRVWEEMDHLAFSLVPESATQRSSAASHNAIRKELLQVLRTVWKHIYCGTPKLVVGFRCPCQGEEGSSRDHLAKYMEDCHELSCRSRFRDGKLMPASPNQLKWFGIHKGKDVVSAGKDNSSHSSPEMLQPVSTNGSSLCRHSQPPLLSHGSTPGPMAACTEKSSSSSQYSSSTSQRMVEQCTHTPTHPACISSGTSSAGQFVSDHQDTAQPLESRALRKYEDSFFKDVTAKVIARGLCRREVIPENVMNQIGRSDSDKDARELLFDHLKQHGNVDSLKAFCEEIISSDYKGYPNMQSIGKEMKTMLEQEGKAVGSAGKEKSPRCSFGLPVSVSTSNSQPPTSQSQPCTLRRANTTGAGMQSSTKKRTEKRSRSLPNPRSHLLTEWFTPIHSHPDTQQLNGGSQTVGTQVAHHSSPLHPTHSSSSSSPGIFSGGAEEVTPALPSERDDVPSDTDMAPPPAKKTKPTHSTSGPEGST